MTEFCKNGHERTDSNTSFVRDNARNRVRKRCLDCRNAKRTDVLNKGAGTNHRNDLKRLATDYLHEDIEDLLRFGATFHEIIQRGGYSSWNTLKQSLHRRGRTDLLEQLKERRKQVTV